MRRRPLNVVYLHAFPLDERMWEPETGPHLYSLGSTMDEWAQAILASERDPFVAVGASMGGYCALALARQAPERVHGLVLAGSRADPDTPERKQARDATIAKIRNEGVEALWAETGGRLFSDGAPRAAVERARAIALEQDPEGLVAGVAAMRDRADSTEVVAGFGAPLLVAVGDSDPYFSAEEARALSELAPRGSLHLFEDCGHLASLERPVEFRRVLEDFLAGF
jgi:pimeloyl-ACP methyl ester carboxylesterase